MFQEESAIIPFYILKVWPIEQCVAQLFHSVLMMHEKKGRHIYIDNLFKALISSSVIHLSVALEEKPKGKKP